MNEQERIGRRLTELEREVARLRAGEYVAQAGTLLNANATIDASGNATLAGYVTNERLGSSSLANGATHTMTTAVGVAECYLYTAAIGWSTYYDVILCGLVARGPTGGGTVQQIVSHASWTVAINGSYQLTLTNGTGSAAILYVSLLRLY